jgi:hypothetical protein
LVPCNGYSNERSCHEYLTNLHPCIHHCFSGNCSARLRYWQKGKRDTNQQNLFAIGLLIVGVAVVLLLMDVIESGVAAVIGIVGIGLIATSGISNIKRMR